jgi:hypothetical protein
LLFGVGDIEMAVQISMKMTQKQAGAMYMKLVALENEMKELKESWYDLVGNTAEPDAFGNVTISEIDYNAFDKLIASK